MLQIDGARITHRLGGDGPPAVLTPGGRLGYAAVEGLADVLRPHLRLLEWDRRNTGRSDLWLGPGSEQARWVDDLAAALVRLDLAPAWLLGGSAGARVSYLTALRHPEVVRGMVLWSVSGGHWGSQMLGHDYHVPFATAALRGGMEAVAETPFFAARLAGDDEARAQLLAIDPDQFVREMVEWSREFEPAPDRPAIGVTEAELATIEVPTLVFEGNDLVHPPEAAAAVQRSIPGAVLAPSPWTGEEFTDRFVGRSAEPLLGLYPRLAPQIVSFIDSHEG